MQTTSPHDIHFGKVANWTRRESLVIRREIEGPGTADAEAMVWVEKQTVSGGLHVIGEHEFSAAGPGKALRHGKDATTEDLGERVIEGVVAKGTRSAAAFGSRRRWYAT